MLHIKNKINKTENSIIFNILLLKICTILKNYNLIHTEKLNKLQHYTVK